MLKGTQNSPPCSSGLFASVEEAAIRLICGDLDIRTWYSYRGGNENHLRNGNFSETELAVESVTSSNVQVLPTEKQLGHPSMLTEKDAKDRSYKSFDEHLEDLVKYKNIHGHCNPPSTQSLGRWCRRVRYEYNRQAKGRFKKNGEKLLTSEKIKKLEAIGFQFSSSSTCKNFEQRLKELVKFREIHGHCHVPRSYPSLGKWCSSIRIGYNQVQKGEIQTSGSKLTMERVKALEEIGFDFLHQSNAFEQRLMELEKFKEIHGHCNVPTGRANNLGNWCKNVRTLYNQLQNGEIQASQTLNADRIKALKEIGFHFSPLREKPT